MLLFEEIFDFKWQNGIFVAKRRDRKEKNKRETNPFFVTAIFSFSFRNRKNIRREL